MARTLWLVAAACWLTAGPGGVTVQAVMACQHRQAHQPHAGHAGGPGDAPCFCDEMTGGSTLAISPAVPAVLPGAPEIPRPVRARSYPSRSPLPPSPSLAPESPPPNGLV
ncbi:MAG TPA: hypothetical protein VEK78_01855 [Gemmatimonadales bacterium]|nr:hypothetical protein [Gemmatimonadales bacterium]